MRDRNGRRLRGARDRGRRRLRRLLRRPPRQIAGQGGRDRDGPLTSELLRRLEARDHTLWPDGNVAPNRLGWPGMPRRMPHQAPPLNSFAAQGCNSVIATRTAIKLANYVVTGAGFGP